MFLFFLFFFLERVHTREGSLVALFVLKHTNAKDRKAVLRTFKPYIEKVRCRFHMLSRFPTTHTHAHTHTYTLALLPVGPIIITRAAGIVWFFVCPCTLPFSSKTKRKRTRLLLRSTDTWF